MNNSIKRTMTVIAAATLITSAFAATAASIISGFLPAETYDSWYGTFGTGWHSVSIDGAGLGDLDLTIYDACGNTIAYDAELDNDPYVDFYLPYTQEVTIVVENADEWYSSSYTGVVR